MFERRPILGLLIGLTLCISIWRISVQESPLYPAEYGYGSQLSYDDHRPSPTAYGHRHSHPEPAESHQQRLVVSEGRTTPLNFDSENSISNNNLSLASFAPSMVTQSPLLSDFGPLPANDYSRLIDLNDFKFLINQPPCPRRNAPFFLILVHSAPDNHEKREVIRGTWGSVQSRHLRLLFLVGSVPTAELQQQLDNENSKYLDLIQGNFVDNYRNMTYKHVMALKWFVYYCSEAKFLIKTDDDVFVNTLQLLEYMELRHQLQQQPPLLSPFTPRTYHVPSSSSSSSTVSSSDSLSRNTSHILNVIQSKNFLFCKMQAEARVKRSYRSKWRVSGKEFPGRYYPPYCPGYSIMYSPDVVYRLYKESQRVKYFWIDDVHITGTLAQRSNITITSFWPQSLNLQTYEKLMRGKTDMGHHVFLFAWANISEEQVRDLWALTSGHFNSTPLQSGNNGVYKYDSFR